MNIKKSAKKFAGFIGNYSTEIIGASLIFGAGYGTKYYLGEYNIYALLAQATTSLLVLAYIERVKYHWVDN